MELQPSQGQKAADVHVLVMSLQKNETSTIRVKCYLSTVPPTSLQATVTKGHYFVIGAVVVATISFSSKDSTPKILLNDDGKGK